jgi:hypothetical protein
MEIKTIEEAKLKIGGVIKFAPDGAVSENLKGLKVLSGTIIKITSTWEHTKEGDVCISFQSNIDVIDPIDGFPHHMTATRIFDDIEKDMDIVNVASIDEIAKLQARIVELEASKTLTEKGIA